MVTALHSDLRGMIAWSVAVKSWLPLLYFPLGRLYGGWLHQLFALTQHSGLAEDVRDHRLNTRTLNLNPFFRFLYFNMNYHIERHMFPMVVGVTPEVELARSGGLTVENGIVTDACCRTSGAGIYAAGDAAHFFHPLFGRSLRLEAWRHAERHGQVAALNMLGQAVEYRDVPWMWSDQYDLHLQVAGLLDDADVFVSRGTWEEGAIILFALKQGRLRGAVGMGKGDSVGRDIRVAQLIIEAETSIHPDRLCDPRIKLKSLLPARTNPLGPTKELSPR